MIGVYIQDNGNVTYRCSICDMTETVDYALSTSPFWDVYLGRVLAAMLGHYMDSHYAAINSA